MTLALLSCQKLKNRFCRAVNKLPWSLLTEEYVHGRKSAFEMEMLLKFGSYLITYIPLCSVSVQAPWPEPRKGKELSAFTSCCGERDVSSAYPSLTQFSAAPEGLELSIPIYLQRGSQTWSQEWFNVPVLSVQSICSETAALALPSRSQNRQRSAVRRDSAVSCQGDLSLLLCWGKDALMGTCTSLRCTAKLLCRRRVLLLDTK